MKDPADLPSRPKPINSGRRSWVTLMLAGLLALLVLSGLSLLTGGFFLWVIVIVGLVFMVTAFHYLIWGRWLRRQLITRGEDER
jgi:hypothetical protein